MKMITHTQSKVLMELMSPLATSQSSLKILKSLTRRMRRKRRRKRNIVTNLALPPMPMMFSTKVSAIETVTMMVSKMFQPMSFGWQKKTQPVEPEPSNQLCQESQGEEDLDNKENLRGL
mmetsp:Transcript_105767/g.215674  ORF Transcript_105767/g.215674 Transcript_105767/m.215674 type:complete len:119 (-) Transcript_105767:742-1098(-)